MQSGGNPKNVKDYNNALHKPFFEIPLLQVYTCTSDYNKTTYIQACIPGLHISLGLFHRVFTLLEEECHALDMAAADNNFSDLDCSHTSTPFQQYHAMVKEMSSLKATKENAQANAEATEQVLTLVSLLGDSPQLQHLHDSALYNRRLMDEIVMKIIIIIFFNVCM